MNVWINVPFGCCEELTCGKSIVQVSFVLWSAITTINSIWKDIVVGYSFDFIQLLIPITIHRQPLSFSLDS